MTNLINLDDEKVTLTFTVNGHDFTIRRIVMSLRDLWVMFVGKTTDFNQKLIAAAAGEMQNADELLQEFAEWKAEYIDKMMSKLLASNGYDYDQDWWADNADYNDIMRILSESVMKDEQDAKKKAADE